MKKLILFCKKHHKILLPISLGCSIIGILMVVFALRQNPSFYWLQFAVDQKERVYIGTLNDGVKVYENQKKVGTISFTNRGYSFTIRDGTELIYSSATGVVYVDLRRDFLNSLEKSIIKKEPVTATNPHFKLYNKKFVCNGQTYYAKVTPCSCEVLDESNRQLLMLGDKRWNIALVFSAVFLVFPLFFGVPLKAYKNPPSFWESGCRKDASGPLKK